MYHEREIAHYTDTELIELWRERVTMAVECVPDHQAEHVAAREVQRWCGKPWPAMPSEIRQAAAKKFKTQEMFG